MKPPASHELQKPLAQFGLDPSLIPCKQEYQEVITKSMIRNVLQRDGFVVDADNISQIKEEKDPDKSANLKLNLVKEETDPDTNTDNLVLKTLSSLKTEPTNSFSSSSSISHSSSADPCQQGLNMDDLKKEPRRSGCQVSSLATQPAIICNSDNSTGAYMDDLKPCLDKSLYLVIKSRKERGEGKAKKKTKLTGQPKRPMSAYFLWLNSEGRDKIKVFFFCMSSMF